MSAAYILTIMLLDPAGKAQAPVIHEHKDHLSCQVERATLYATDKKAMKGWTLRSAECTKVAK